MRKGDFNPAAHGLRGVASLMVLGAHILGGPAKHVYNSNAEYVSFVQGPWSFGIYGVNLFFVISGFVIWGSVVRYLPAEFALRRFFRIYPLFFVSTLIFALLNAATNAYPKINDPLSVVSAFLFLDLFTGTEQLAPNAWSLTYEVVYYALTCLTFHLALRQRNVILGLCSLALSAAFVVAFPITFYFIGGLLIRILYDRGTAAPRGPIAPILEIAFAAMCVWTASTGLVEYTWARMSDPLVPLRIIVTFGYFYLAVQEGSLTERLLSNRLIVYFGMVSYSLYLVHPYVYFVVRALFSKYHLFTDQVLVSMTLFALTTIAVTLPATHIVHIFLERWPYQRFFHQQVYRTRTVASFLPLRFLRSRRPETGKPRQHGAEA